MDQTLIPNREVVLKFNNKFATKIDFCSGIEVSKRVIASDKGHCIQNATIVADYLQFILSKKNKFYSKKLDLISISSIYRSLYGIHKQHHYTVYGIYCYMRHSVTHLF